jgi:hypothetical protein
LRERLSGHRFRKGLYLEETNAIINFFDFLYISRFNCRLI